jgi:hypothetical protein
MAKWFNYLVKPSSSFFNLPLKASTTFEKKLSPLFSMDVLLSDELDSSKEKPTYKRVLSIMYTNKIVN